MLAFNDLDALSFALAMMYGIHLTYRACKCSANFEHHHSVNRMICCRSPARIVLKTSDTGYDGRQSAT